jgi:hypothetical protein
MADAGCVVGHYRITALGGLSIPVAVARRADGTIAIVRPLARRLSRSGAHGTYFFPADIDALIHLGRTNTGHRYVHVRCLSADADFCNALKRCVRDLWVTRGLSARDVIAALPSSCR